MLAILTTNPFKCYVYLIVTAPAGDLAPHSARPSTGPILIINYIFFQPVMILNTISGLDAIDQNWQLVWHF